MHVLLKDVQVLLPAFRRALASDLSEVEIMKLITVLVPEKILEILDDLVRDGMFASRSHAIRFAIQQFIYAQGYAKQPKRNPFLSPRLEAREQLKVEQKFKFALYVTIAAEDRAEAIEEILRIVTEVRSYGHDCKWKSIR